MYKRNVKIYNQMILGSPKTRYVHIKYFFFVARHTKLFLVPDAAKQASILKKLRRIHCINLMVAIPDESAFRISKYYEMKQKLSF